VQATRKRCNKHAPSSKTECNHLNGGKSKAVTYAFPPGYKENAEEEEEEEEDDCILVLATLIDNSQLAKLMPQQQQHKETNNKH
jgi:hypothetical protein